MITIKFRVWDGKNMHDDVLVNSFGAFIYAEKTYNTPNIEIDGFSNEKIIIMQFTGLHDKNGKEIYEGDVFKSILNSLGNELINPKLVYEGLRWVLKDSSKNINFEYLDYYEADTELEVVGNIHENHELL